MDRNENYELKRYKYSSIAMTITYIVVTFFDLLHDSLSNQAVIIFSMFLVIDSGMSFYEKRNIGRLLLTIVMAIIFIFFTVDYFLMLF